jgi:uncharacterized protein with HEPN domain
MRPETAAALFDMNRAVERITEATTAKTLEDFQGDWFFQSAIERQFEILGEALVRVRELEMPVFDRIRDAPKMVGLRNIIIHGYDAVDPRVLWAIVEERLPELRRLLTELLRVAGGQGL